MFKVEKVEVKPNPEKFGLEHKLYIKGDIKKLEESFKKYASAQNFSAEGKKIELEFSPSEVFEFLLEKPLEEYYEQEIHQKWKEMVSMAMGMEEPFRFYSFYTESGKHIGTVGFKPDCDNFTPVILIYNTF
ncbi:MAG TPA: hypothetical protein EYH18_01175 [Aquifex sp.]|nr:hypothetical protein [Aquifex sp.]